MSRQFPWKKPPHGRHLIPGQVHVWMAELELPPAQLERAAAVLSPAEREQAGHFLRPADRHQYLASHAFLRLLLAGYLCRPPASLLFNRGPHGKPELADPDPGLPIMFNLSHARHRALCAVAWNQAVGVDVEWIPRQTQIDEVAERFFAPGEVKALRALPPSRQRQAFFNGWTRKEAFLKARGVGLSLPLNRFEVTLAPDQPARLLALEGEPAAPDQWSLHNLPMPADYCGALAVHGRTDQVVCFQFGFCDPSP